jgi:hypothetical protein
MRALISWGVYFSFRQLAKVQLVPMWRFTECDGAVNVGYGLALCGFADQDFAVFGERYD